MIQDFPAAALSVDVETLSGVAPAIAREPCDEQPGRLRIHLRADPGQPWRGMVRFRASLPLAPTETPYFLLPSFLHGTNRAEEPFHPKAKLWPRLRLGPTEPPFAPAFEVKAERLTHPLAFVRGRRGCRALLAPPYLHRCDEAGTPVPGDAPVPAGFGVAWEEDRATVTYCVGYRHAPWLYRASRIEREEGLEEPLALRPGQQVAFTLDVVAFPCGDTVLHDASQVVRAAYARFHEPPRADGLRGADALSLLAGAIYEDAFSDKAVTYITSAKLEAGRVVPDEVFFSISWTGGLAVAGPLLAAAHRLRDRDPRAESMRAQALGVLDHFCQTSRNEASGLPFDAWRDGRWSNDGWWREYIWSLEDKRGHSSYLVGEAIYFLLRAYQLERDFAQTERADWLAFARDTISAMDATLNNEGEYPYRWCEQTGKPLEFDSFCGAWCLAAKALLARVTGDPSLLPSAATSLAYYADRYVRRLDCYGAPLDTWKAPDSEGILAFIIAARLLHELTGDPAHLTCLRDGLELEYVWRYAYNTRISLDPLRRLGWTSCGGSVTSVANQCASPMAGLIADAADYYVRTTGDAYHARRQQDLLGFLAQTFNRFDGEFDHGKAGWLAERFDATASTSFDNYPDGTPASTWFIYHPWAAACILEAFTSDS